MSHFILELYCEEIPARMQQNAATNLANIANEILTKNNLNYTNLNTHINCNRIFLQISNIANQQANKIVKKTGPQINANQASIDGFLKANKLQSISELQVENGFFVLYLKQNQSDNQQIISKSMPLILQKMQNVWDKTMPFNGINWVRPIRNILALFNNNIVSFEFAGLASNNTLFIDKFTSINIANTDQYLSTLKNNSIILDFNERCDYLNKQLQQLATKHNINLINDPQLLVEVAGLSEKFAVLPATIRPEFLQLPAEALILTLKNNQKYFLGNCNQGKLAGTFLFVTNQLNAANHNKIIADNEKVVNARLTDLAFFIDEDLKIPLYNRLESLKKITFHQQLGTVFAKVQRIKDNAKFISVFIPHCQLNLIDTVVNLAKADLTTKAVSEMPELQGKIGSFYATKQGESVVVAESIYQHYLPISINSALPSQPVAIAISLADKIDNLLGFFIIGKKPTSSKDPFALRRQAIALIRLIYQHNLQLPLELIFDKAFYNFDRHIFAEQNQQKKCKNFKAEVLSELKKFIIERLKVFAKEQLNIPFALQLDNKKLNIANVLNDAVAFVNLGDKGQMLINAYKRISNLGLNQEQAKFTSKVKCTLELEKLLLQATINIKKSLSINSGNALPMLGDLADLLQNFLDNILINDSDKNKKNARLALINNVLFLFAKIIPFIKNVT